MIGYGDIGQSCARMARVFGMHIVALRRRTDLSESERESGLKVGPARCHPCKHVDPALVLQQHLGMSKHVVTQHDHNEHAREAEARAFYLF